VAQRGRLRVLLEVRLDPVATKSGVSDEELPRLVEAVLRMPHLELRGLMGVPPYFADAELVRPYFAGCVHCAMRCGRNSAEKFCRSFQRGCRMISRSPSKRRNRDPRRDGPVRRTKEGLA